MDKEYQLKNVGKKMPYTMPEGFFSQVQEEVLAVVDSEEKAKHHHHAVMKRIYIVAASMAASVCLVLGLGYSMLKTDAPRQPKVSIASVDKAYDNLTLDEQQDLNATYANDVYLSME